MARPRSAVADEAILDSTMELFAELGYEGLSIEGVAEHAGVAKSTVYRRYPCKVDLVVAAMTRVSPPVPEPPDTGSLEGDLLDAVKRFRTTLTRSEVGRALPAVLGAAARHPEFAAVHRNFIADRRRTTLRIVERAKARGELAADADGDVLVDLVYGLVFYRVFNSGGPVTDAALADVVAAAVRAFT